MTSVCVVIPVYNEALAIAEILRRVCSAKIPDQFTLKVVVVDDGSTDETAKIVENWLTENPKYAPSVNFHKGLVNHGKGAALRAGFALADADIILVQDGDLEYSPDDYMTLLTPFSDPKVDIVYGSRFTKGIPVGMKKANALANLILTHTSRLLYGQNITDEATGFKVFRSKVLSSISLECRGFEFCPEFMGKISVQGYKITEVPISYNPRGILEGKKIKPSDGFIAIWWLGSIWLQAKKRQFLSLFNPQATRKES